MTAGTVLAPIEATSSAAETLLDASIRTWVSAVGTMSFVSRARVQQEDPGAQGI